MNSQINKPKMLVWIKEELPNVSKMKQQLTYAEIDKLEAEFGKKEIQETLEAMDNFAPLTKKYLSVYRTCRNWMRLNRKKEQRFQQMQQKRLGLNTRMEHSECLTYLERKGIPFDQILSHFTPEQDPNGKTYWRPKQ
jgi:hypothetical protein